MKYSPGGRYFKYRPPLGLSWSLDRTWTATYRLRISEISKTLSSILALLLFSSTSH